MRYFVELAYDGTHFHGWQRQKSQRTVQEEVEKAFSLIVGEALTITGCGRTDAGVHARQYFCHFDTENRIEETTFLQKTNGILKEEIKIARLIEVQPEDHARYHANSRMYQYFFHLEKDPFLRHYSYECSRRDLNLDLMQSYVSELPMFRDYKILSKFNPDVKSTLCEVAYAKLTEVDSRAYCFEIAANRFLHNMVRRIVGTMVLIGAGKISMTEFRDAMSQQSNLKLNFLAPAQGLFLTKIDYPFL